MGRLDALDLSLSLSRKEEAERLEAGQRRLLEVQLTLAGLLEGPPLGPGVCVLFEGWDAAGKGGAIKRLVARLDPRHVSVVPFAAPRAAPPLPVALLAGAAGARQHDRARPLVVWPRARGACRGPDRRGRLAPRLRGDRRLRARAWSRRARC